MKSPEAVRPGGRFARIAAGAFLALAALLILVIAAVVYVAHSLDAPWLKSRLLAKVEQASGFELDYGHAQLALTSGLRVEELVVRSPKSVRAVAPELVHLGSLDAHWSLGSLLGSGNKLEQVSLRDLAVTLAIDEDAPATPTNASTAPAQQDVPSAPSRMAAQLLASAPPVAKVDVSGVSFAYVRVKSGQVKERWAVSGFALGLGALADGAAWKLQLHAGVPGTPLKLQVAHDGDKIASQSAQLALALDAELRAGGARATLDLEIVHQNFDARLLMHQVAHLEFGALFDAKNGQIAVDLSHSRLAEGAVQLDARVLLPDDPKAPKRLDHATADVDLDQALKLVPAKLLPFRLASGNAHLRAQDLELAAVPQPGPHGELTLDAELADAHVAAGDTTTIALGKVKLALQATPDPAGGLAANATLELHTLKVDGETPITADPIHLELHAKHLQPELGSPLRVVGDVELAAKLDSLEVTKPAVKISAEQVGVHVHAPLPSKAPFAVQLEVPIGQLHVADAHGKHLLDAPVHVQLDASELDPDLEDVRRTRGHVNLALELGDVKVKGEVTKAIDAVAYTLGVDAPTLAIAKPALPPALVARAPWDRMTVALTSKGEASALFSDKPHLEHHTELHVAHAAFDKNAADTVDLVLNSKGDAWTHDGDFDLQLGGLRVDEKDGGTQHLAATFGLQRSASSISVHLHPVAGPKVTLVASAAVVRAKHALDLDLLAQIENLGALGPLLALEPLPPALDTSQLAVELQAKGRLTGVVDSLRTDGSLKLAPEPLHTAAFNGALDLKTAGFHWTQGTTDVTVPTASLHADVTSEGDKRTAKTSLVVEGMTLDLSDRHVTVAGIADEATTTLTGPLDRADLAFTQKLSVHQLEQKPVVPYPVAELTLSATGRREPNGLIHVEDLELHNPGANTTLKLKGTLDLSDARRRLAVRGSLDQDLAKLAGPSTFQGEGKVSLDFRVASPDLIAFRMLSDLRMQGVHLHLPDQGIALDGVDGDLPLTENLEVAGGTVRLLHELDVNPYSQLRFADQHPLLSRSGYLSVASIVTPYVSIAPLAGNLSINQNVASMSQLEMGVRGGRITGQCVLDWQGLDSTLEAHVRASGVQSSRGEPFDGNAALLISVKDRSVDGRAEILRIGNRHLQDLLDLEDPHHANPALNRIRHALEIGYPDHLRLVFDHGFASLRITFGGLAKLISIDEVRGIPTGQLVDKLVDPLTKTGRRSP